MRSVLIGLFTAAFTCLTHAQFTSVGDIGGPINPGSIVTNGPGSYTLVGGGNELWGTSDQGFLALYNQTGDFDVRVRTESLTPANRWAKAGIMLREDLSPTSEAIFTYVSPPPVPTPSGGDGVNTHNTGWRTGNNLNGGPTGGEHETSGAAPAYPNAWIRMTRVGNNVATFSGTDGTTWTLIRAFDMDNTGDPATAFLHPIPSMALLGFGISSHNNDGNPTATVQFRDFGSPSNVIQITEQPAAQSKFVNQTATFSTRVAGGYDFNTIQWLKNGMPISGATGRTYTTPVLAASDNGTVYTVVVSNTINRTVATSSPATLTVASNPQLADASSYNDPSNTNIYVQFTKDMDPGTTLNIANYAVTNIGGPTPLLSAGDSVLGVAATAGSSSSSASTVGTLDGVNNYPAGEPPANVIDGSASTKYLNFAEQNVGVIITRAAGAGTPQAFRLTTANDAPERDPITITIEGTTASDPTTAAASATWTLLYSGPSGLGTDPGRNVLGPQISLANAAAFNTYRILVTTVRDAAVANSVQFSEVQLFNITGGGGTPVAVTSAAFQSGNPRLVRLGLATPLVAGSSYTVRVSNVQDTAGNVLTPNPSIRTFVHLQGINAPAGLTVKIFNGANTLPLVKAAIASCSTPTFSNSTINVAMEYTTSERPSVADGNTFGQGNTENYGTWIYGTFVPPTTGNYQFGLAADDNAELYLSTDASPANKVLITGQAVWNCFRDYVSPSCNEASGARTPPLSASIPLVAGRSYYMEVIVQEGGGGDHVSVTVRKPGDAAIVDGQAAIPRSLFGTNYSIGCPPTFFFKTPGPIIITTQPQGQTVNELANASFFIGLDGSPIPGVATGYAVQWYSNNVAVAGATNSSYVFPTLRYANGAQYFAIANNGFSSVTSSVVTLNVISDDTAPVLLGAVGSASRTNVTLTFSEPINTTSGANIANYSITNSAGVPLSILSASVRNNTNVVLQTAVQAENVRYTVVLTNVSDRAGLPNVVTAGSRASFRGWVFTPGYALMEIYPTGGGNAVALLTGHPSYPNYPRESYYITSADSRAAYPNDSHEAYGGRISGLFIPTNTANYTFRLAYDDDAQFRGSTTEFPGGAQTLINVVCCSGNDNFGAASPAIPLTQGNRYYYEVLWKEGVGGDYARLSIGGPAGPPIPGALLGVYANPDLANLQIVQGPRDTTNEVGFVAHLNIIATSSPGLPLTFQWYSNGVAIAGASASTYTTAPARLADNGTIYSVVTIVPGGVATNSAVFYVIPDNTAPRVVSVRTDAQFNTVYLTYNEPISEGTATEPSNYALTGPSDPTILSVEYRGSNVVLRLNGLMAPDSTYTLDIFSQFDLAGNEINPDPASVQFRTWVFSCGFVRFDAYLNLNVPANNDLTPLLTAINTRPSTFHYFTNQVNWPQTVPDLNNYGMRFTGLFRAPETGSYKFEPAHDDGSRLNFSSDTSPSNIVATFNEDCCNGFGIGENGLTISLTAGNLYWFELLVIEAGGGDYAGLAVTLPSGTYLAPIPGQYLVSVVDPAESAAINVGFAVQPQNQSIIENTKATFTGVVTNAGPSGAFYQWQVDTGSGFTDIPGANGTNYTTPFQTLANDGNIYRLLVCLPGRTLYSSNAVLDVQADTVKPTVVSARALSLTRIELTFSEQIAAGTAGEASNFQVSSASGVIHVTAAAVGSDATRVVLDLATPLPCELITVTVNGLADLSGNEILPNSQVSFSNYLPFGLQHRYDFSNIAGPAGGATVLDSLGTANGVVLGAGASFTGTRVTLPGGSSATAAYVDLPNGLLSTNGRVNGGSGQLTIEGWVKITGVQNWSRIFDFGNSSSGELTGPGGGGDGRDYLFYSAAEGGNQNRHIVVVREVDPLPDGSTLNSEVGVGHVGVYNADLHFVLTWDEASGQVRIYENGALVNSFTTPVPMSEIHDVNVWLGRSQWSGDANMQGEFDEFRIYNRIVSTNEIALNQVVGPDFNFGQPLAVRLSVPTNRVFEGVVQQASVFADFSSISNVDLTFSRCFNLVSSNPSVIAADESGLLQAGIPGTANLFVTFGGVTSSVVAITVSQDVTKPTVLSVRGVRTLDGIKVLFSEPVSEASAETLSNYTLTGTNGSPVAIGTPMLSADGRTVMISIPSHLPGAVYTLHVEGITDLAGGANVMNPTNVTFRTWTVGLGSLLFDIYSGLSLNPVLLDLTNNPAYPNSPTITTHIAGADSRLFYPDNSHDGYGGRMTGFFVPQITTNYTFYLSSDDASKLFLSTDASESNKVQLTEETGCCQPFASHASASIPLVAGERYFLEIIYKEGTGGDYAQAAVKITDSPIDPNTLAPINGAFLASLADPVGASITITQQPMSTNLLLLGTNTLRVGFTATNDYGDFNQVAYQWQRFNGTIYTNIYLANGATYTTAPVSEGERGRYRVIVYIPGASATSAVAFVNGPNRCPVGTNFTVSISGNTATNIQLMASDPDGDALQYTVTQTASNGVVVLQTNGVARYTPNAGFLCGTDTFRVRVADAGCQTTEITVTINLRAVGPPVVNCPSNITVPATDASGAIVTYVATASQCELVSFTCTPASGSLFPIGQTTVTCTAVNQAGLTNSCSFIVTVTQSIGQGVLRGLLDEIIAFRATVSDKQTLLRLDKIIDDLRASLDSSYWVDQTHLAPKHGHKVFILHKNVVNKLDDLLQKGGAPTATVLDWIARIVAVDRAIAVTAVNEAATNGGSPANIARDRQEIAQGDADAAAGRPESAILHYANAWNHAVKLQVKTGIQTANGKATLRVQAFPNTAYVLQSSTDLMTWTTLATVTADVNGLIQYNDPSPANQKARFYRLIEP